jgi:hypothetical protein
MLLFDEKIKWLTEAKAIFLNPLIVCSSCKRKLFVCLFVDEETKRSYLFAYGQNGLAHLWSYLCKFFTIYQRCTRSGVIQLQILCPAA